MLIIFHSIKILNFFLLIKYSKNIATHDYVNYHEDYEYNSQIESSPLKGRHVKQKLIIMSIIFYCIKYSKNFFCQLNILKISLRKTM